jgi:hypothetical protein
MRVATERSGDLKVDPAQVFTGVLESDLRVAEG